MKDFIKIIKEIKRTLNFLFVFETILNTAIFFLVVYLLLSLINLFPISALIPAAVYFIIKMYINFKKDKRIIVEGKYEPLKEKLRTAVDNFREENPVVEELEEEVVNDLKHVGLSSFIKTRVISYKIFTTILLSFAIVIATMMNLYIADLTDLFTNIPGMIDNYRMSKRGSNIPLGEINESEDIYGDSKLAVLGNQEIDIKIKPVNYEVNVREEGDVEQKQFDEIFPREVNVEQASAFEERIPEEEQELVKKYFNKIATG